MEISLRAKLLTFLGGVVAAARAGERGAALADLAEIPPQMLARLLRAMIGSQWDREDLGALLSLLADDPRRQVRLAALDLIEGVPQALAPWQADRLLRHLARDRDAVVRAETARALRGWLPRLPPAVRKMALWSFARTPDRFVRRALSAALTHPFAVPDLPLVIALLSRDHDPLVRHATAEAAEQRYDENPVAYRAVLRCLADDPKRGVRRGARHALRRIASPSRKREGERKTVPAGLLLDPPLLY